MEIFWIVFSIYITGIVAHGLTRVFAPPTINHVVRVEKIAPSQIIYLKHEVLISEDIIQQYGLDNVFSREKHRMLDQLIEKLGESGCLVLKEVDQWDRQWPPERRFAITFEALMPRREDAEETIRTIEMIKTNPLKRW